MNTGELIATGDANEVLNNKQVRKVYLGDQFRL
jgi:ABC-type lipopolysaccharide export system ATPase subunit